MTTTPCRLAIFSTLIALVLFAGGCATSRGVLDIRPNAIPDNPASGRALVIASVVDNRKFELKPASPEIPSLKNGEIGDDTIKSRAVGRKRNGYGKALGDILLPEDRTVNQVVEEYLTRAFREAGYRVVAKDSADATNAKVLKVSIDTLWSWMTPGMWVISVENRSAVTITPNPSGASAPMNVGGYAILKAGAAPSGLWEGVMRNGLSNLMDNTRDQLTAQQ